MAASEPQKKTDEELMAAYAGGDTSALNEIVIRYGAALTRIMARGMRSQSDLHDLVQQTFLQLHRARKDYRQDKPLRPWLFTIAMNVKRMHLRKLAARREDALGLDGRDEPGGVAQPDLERAERAKQVREALSTLTEGQRTVIELHWLQGLPFEEVATIVGASKSAVKVRAHRGYAILRQRLAELGGNRPDTSSIDEDERSE